MMDAVQSIKTHKWIKALAITALALPLAGYAATGLKPSTAPVQRRIGIHHCGDPPRMCP